MTGSINSLKSGQATNFPRPFYGLGGRPDLRPRLIRDIIARRRLRDAYFPGGLFADPVWDILLELTAAKIDRQMVPISALCAAAAVSTTTALRYIYDLEDRQLVARRPDPNDKRRVFIEIRPAAFEAMMSYLQATDYAEP